MASSSTKDLTDSSSFIIRPAKLTEYKALGQIAASTYFSSALEGFLYPHRVEHYADYERGYEHRALTLMLDPRMISMVACKAATPDIPIAYIHFKRMGDDEGAKEQLKRKGNVMLWVARWLIWAWFLLITAVTGGNQSADPEAFRLFRSWQETTNKIDWQPFKERENRWHVCSFVVRTEFQGRGLGKRLMAEVIKYAEKENVVIGLESSPEGEFMVSQSVC
jgi:ribosomal protein S18 acetylase RimI-like enzyme